MSVEEPAAGAQPHVDTTGRDGGDDHAVAHGEGEQAHAGSGTEQADEGRAQDGQNRRRPKREQRRRPKRIVDGWLILDKPIGLTSTEALGIVKRCYGAAKAGHAGTLDPLASGCLPLAFGEATKTVPYVFEGRKVYRFTVRWGAETDTDDAEGKVVATSDARPDVAAVEAALPAFIGRVEQVPPRYSAIKIDGARAYDLAREGEVIEMKSRIVEIDSLEVVGVPDADHLELETECGKGTYVRAIARDLGRMLGCYGHVSALRRLAVGPFDEEDFVTLDEVRASAEGREDAPPLPELMLPVDTALAEMFELDVNRVEASRLLRGQSIIVRGRDLPPLGETIYATCAGRLVALGEVEQGALVPRRVFHLAAQDTHRRVEVDEG
ncbi:tRNA pseudouridine(55) synthase TruB [Pseudoxanthobacter sp. M-2]|uniref:tRNA pseudouridine(55) synthase TruB n=1 Tax=Pseudoxanthobacter sp. M-2 TaxID=3078754 RepID=UPI0038FC0822